MRSNRTRPTCDLIFLHTVDIRWIFLRLKASIKVLWHSSMKPGGFFDLEALTSQLATIQETLSNPSIWSDTEKTKDLSVQQKNIQEQMAPFHKGDEWISTIDTLFELYDETEDISLYKEIDQEIHAWERWVTELSFLKLFSSEHDSRPCFVEIQSGSGGTEAQDWAMMLMRMYLRYCEHKAFTVDILEEQPGEVAGMKSVVLRVTGPMAYGWLKNESGVHRLVRKSPFDSGNRRHTSFASVFVYPEVDDTIDIHINPADLRIDTYRASGAGGQHVNTTESAIRVTHVPSGIVVTCQSERSQHQNKAHALKQLAAKLYQMERALQLQAKATLEAHKDDITWGSQIRSYVLDKSMIKDLRTGYETSNTSGVLNGALEPFILAALKAGCHKDKE